MITKEKAATTRVWFEYTLDGEGGLNYGESEKITYSKVDSSGREKKEDKTIKRLKKNTYRHGGQLVSVPKVSSNCIRHGLFQRVENFILREGESMTSDSKDKLFWARFGTLSGLMRGYMNAAQGETYKRFSAVVASSATGEVHIDQEGNTLVPEISEEFFSSSSRKEATNGAASIFNAETVGRVRYFGDIHIDLVTLQFFPISPGAERSCVPLGKSGDKNGYEEIVAQMKNGINTALKRYLTQPNEETANHGIVRFRGSVLPAEVGEFGVLLTDKGVSAAVWGFLKDCLLPFQIFRGGRARANLDSMKIYVEDANFDRQEFMVITKGLLSKDALNKFKDRLFQAKFDNYDLVAQGQDITEYFKSIERNKEEAGGEDRKKAPSANGKDKTKKRQR